MTLSREQFKDQMVDYLYGELAAEERAAFEASVAQSEELRRELASMQGTLRSARAGLQSLAEEAPARVRQNVLAFAEQHKPARSVNRVRVTDAPTGSGWLARFSQPRWVGALSVAAIAGLALLTNSLSQHDTLSDLEPAPQSAAQPTAASAERANEAAPVLEPVLPAEPAEPQPARELGAHDRQPSAKRSAPQATRSRRAEPSASKGIGSATSGSLEADEARAELRAPEPAALAPAAAEAKAEGFGSGAVPAKSSTHATANAEREMAQPVDDLGSAAARRSGNSAPGGAAIIAAPAPRASLSADDLVKQARAHVAAGRMPQAIADYRTLLQRFPKDKRALEWTKTLQRLVQGQEL
jgi:hypothetical protein